MSDEQAARLIHLLELQAQAQLQRPQPCQPVTAPCHCNTPSPNFDPVQVQYAQSLARFNEGVSREATASQQNFTMLQQTAWALQQQALFGFNGASASPKVAG